MLKATDDKPHFSPSSAGPGVDGEGVVVVVLLGLPGTGLSWFLRRNGVEPLQQIRPLTPQVRE